MSNPSAEFVNTSQLKPNESKDERFARQYSEKLAAIAISRLPLADYSSESHILDSACGPGVVTRLLLSSTLPSISTQPGLPIHPPPRVTGIDLAPEVIEKYKAHSSLEKWDTATAFVRDAEDLTCFRDAEFDAIVMNLGIFNLTNAVHGAAEMHRVLKSGGYAAVTTWKHTAGSVVLQKVVDAIKGPGQEALSTPPEWRTKEKLVQVLVDGGFPLAEMEIWAEDIKWEVSGVDEIVESLTTPILEELIWKGWSQEEKNRINGEIINQLTDNERETASLTNIGWICIVRKS